MAKTDDFVYLNVERTYDNVMAFENLQLTIFCLRNPP